MLNKEKPVTVEIDAEKCTKCGICADNCTAEYIIFENNEIKADNDNFLGCTQCGRCMMTCPTGAIKVRGDGFSEEDVFSLQGVCTDFESLNNLFLKRRSCRKFRKEEISQEVIEKIINAASTAPMSIPPSEVKVLVINGSEKVQEFADEAVKRFDKMAKFLNPFMLEVLKPFVGVNKQKLMKEFVVPLLKVLSIKRKEGRDIFLYNAPAMLVFYGTEASIDNTDQIIAATYADIAAQALGLGTCIIGSVPPAFDESLKAKYGISKGEKVGYAFILGYPEKEFKKGIKRRFNAVKYY